MNISAWNFAEGRTQSNGKLHDLIANNVAEITPLARYDHVLSSVGNQVELELYDRRNGVEQPLLMSIHGKNISDQHLQRVFTKTMRNGIEELNMKLIFAKLTFCTSGWWT